MVTKSFNVRFLMYVSISVSLFKSVTRMSECLSSVGHVCLVVWLLVNQWYCSVPWTSWQDLCLVPCLTVGAWLVCVAGLEQEALVVWLGSIVNVVLCPKVAFGNYRALMRTTFRVVDVEIIDIHNVVSLCGAGVVTTKTFGDRGFLRPCCTLVT